MKNYPSLFIVRRVFLKIFDRKQMSLEEDFAQHGAAMYVGVPKKFILYTVSTYNAESRKPSPVFRVHYGAVQNKRGLLVL